MWLYKLARFVCGIVLHLWYRVEYIGKENIPQGGGYMVVSNHQCFADPIFLALGIRERICFMAKAELFSNWLFRWAFLTIGSIPVNRGAGDTSAIDSSAQLIEQGGILGLFPEGTRSKDGKPLRPKSGAALIARMTKADILPCAITYHNGREFRSQVTVRYGEKIPFEALGFETDSARELKEATRLLWGKVLELLGVEEDAH